MFKSFFKKCSQLFSKHRRFFVIFAPAFIGSIFIFLCFTNLTRSIWFDESYSAFLTRFDFFNITNLTSFDVHPPLYYFLLKIWGDIFGRSDIALRSLSVFFGALTILCFYLWLKYRYGLRVAILASLALALLPLFVRYGQEMRMYTLMTFFAAAGTLVLALALDTKKTIYWVFYALILALGLYTHYFLALVWLAHFGLLVSRFKTKLLQQKALIRCYLLAFFLFLPWLFIFAKQASHLEVGGFWIPPVSLNTISDYFAMIFAYQPAGALQGWFALAAFVLLACTVFFALRFRRPLKSLLYCALLPFVLLVLLSLPPLRPVFFYRYLLPAMIFAFLLFIVGAIFYFRESSPKTVFRRVLLVILIFSLGLCFVSGHNAVRAENLSLHKELAQNLAAFTAKAPAPIIVDVKDVSLVYDLSFYFSGAQQIKFIAKNMHSDWGSLEPLRQYQGTAINDLTAFKKTQGHFFFVDPLADDKNKKTDLSDFEGFTVREEAIFALTNAKDEHPSYFRVLSLARE